MWVDPISGQTWVGDDFSLLGVARVFSLSFFGVEVAQTLIIWSQTTIMEAMGLVPEGNIIYNFKNSDILIIIIFGDPVLYTVLINIFLAS